MLTSRHQEEHKKVEELQLANSAAQNQIQQLLYLNNQLKSKTDLLEQKVSGMCNTNNNGEIETQLKDLRSSNVPTSKNIDGEMGCDSTDMNEIAPRYCYVELKEAGSCSRKKTSAVSIMIFQIR